jgi:hypothetical protein
MATASGIGPNAKTTRFSFWAKMAMGMSLFIVFAFGQFALRGFVPYRQVPLIFHVHGVVMLCWLGLLVAQSLLGAPGSGTRKLHRQLGWASVVMAPLIVVLAVLTCLAGLRTGIFPPFFTPAYFLALVPVSALCFAALVGLAVARRREAGWHKRLMVGSTILLMDPALGRVLPMPFIVPWGEWLAMAVELAMVWLIVRHDRREAGRAHPATALIAATVVLSHVLVELLAITPAWIAFAQPFRS